MKNILDRPQVLFLIICTFWSLLFAFFNPPFQAPDEPEHLYKIYGMSQGSWSFKKLTQPIYENGEYIGTVTKSGNIFPNGLIDASLVTYDLHFSPYKKTSFQETREIAKIKLQKETQYFMNYGVPAYTPISYMPSVIFVWLLSLFNTTPFVILMVARLCSLFTYLIFGYYAIKITDL